MNVTTQAPVRCTYLPTSEEQEKRRFEAAWMVEMWRDEVIRRQFVEINSPSTAAMIVFAEPHNALRPHVELGAAEGSLFKCDRQGNRSLRQFNDSHGLKLSATRIGFLKVLSGLVSHQPYPGDPITLKLRIALEGSDGSFGWCEVEGWVEPNLLKMPLDNGAGIGLKVTWVEPGEAVPEFFFGAYQKKD